MTERGNIIVEQAYALGKMLDHSSWQKGDRRLPKLVTPSDADKPNITIFDNNGKIIWCEFARGEQVQFAHLQRGQRLVYESIARGFAMSIVVICSHDVTPADGRRIDSRHDITSVQVMLADAHGIVTRPVFIGNRHWQNLVFCWFISDAAPAIVRRTMFGLSAKKDLEAMLRAAEGAGQNREQDRLA